jgi:hypothetical protein
MYTDLDYGWEFLGVTSPGFVLTPHTLRCLRAVVTSHRMGVGTCLQVLNLILFFYILPIKTA